MVLTPQNYEDDQSFKNSLGNFHGEREIKILQDICLLILQSTIWPEVLTYFLQTRANKHRDFIKLSGILLKFCGKTFIRFF